MEQAFGMLKAHWRIALKRVEQKTSTLKKTVIAVCVLHNICMNQKDYLYGTDNNDSGDSSDHDNDGGIRLGVLIFKAY